MAERRPLTEGLKQPPPPIDPLREKEFVYGDKPAVPPQAPPSVPPPTLNRVSLTTRIRGDFAAALKRASLERQLHGIEPNTLQDILEEAIEPWLRANNYLR